MRCGELLSQAVARLQPSPPATSNRTCLKWAKKVGLAYRVLGTGRWNEMRENLEQATHDWNWRSRILER